MIQLTNRLITVPQDYLSQIYNLNVLEQKQKQDHSLHIQTLYMSASLVNCTWSDMTLVISVVTSSISVSESVRAVFQTLRKLDTHWNTQKDNSFYSLIPRPLPNFISQPWRKIGRKPGIIATSRAGNGGHG